MNDIYLTGNDDFILTKNIDCNNFTINNFNGIIMSNGYNITVHGILKINNPNFLKIQ